MPYLLPLLLLLGAGVGCCCHYCLSLSLLVLLLQLPKLFSCFTSVGHVDGSVDDPAVAAAAAVAVAVHCIISYNARIIIVLP